MIRPDEDRALRAIAEMVAEASERLPRLRVVEERKVAKTDWLHGLAACWECGLSLDPEKDLDSKIYDGLPMTWSGVRGTHRRCGAAFTLRFK